MIDCFPNALPINYQSCYFVYTVFKNVYNTWAYLFKLATILKAIKTFHSNLILLFYNCSKKYTNTLELSLYSLFFINISPFETS